MTPKQKQDALSVINLIKDKRCGKLKEENVKMVEHKKKILQKNKRLHLGYQWSHYWTN